MKRILLSAAAACLVLASLSCSKSGSEEGRTVIRYLAAPDIGGAAAEIIRGFEKLHPEIKVEMVEGPAATGTRETMYTTAFMAGNDTYDMAYLDVIWVPKFAGQGWLVPLDGTMSEEEKKAFLPGDMNGSTYKGRIYRMPMQSDGGMLYYRKDLLRKYGFQPPKTFDELTAAAVKIQHPPELWGFVFQGKQYEGLVCDYLEVLWGHGGELIGEDGTVKVDSPEAVAALQWMVDAVHKNKITPKGVLNFQEEEARHMFQEGKAVFMRNWPYAWNLLQEDKSSVKGQVGIIPMVSMPGKKGAATLGGWGYGISAFSKHKEEAWKFIQYATNAHSQKIAYMKSGIIPTRKALFDDPEIIRRSPHYRELYKVLMGARPRPVHPRYARISDVLQVRLSAALSGQETPEQALRKAARRLRSFVR